MNGQKGKPVAIASPTLPAVETRQHLSDLFAAHHRRVLLAAYRITGSMADAEDVAQSVFLRLADSGGELAMSNEGSYLYRAAINGALDLLRKRAAAKSESLDAAGDVAWQGAGSRPEAEFSSRELMVWLRKALGELSPRAAEMFTLRYVEELDNREIAAMMQTSQAVVAVTLHQARSRLKKQLQEIERGKR
jgi:RNA polymerase sigma-70 factor (ECF subfamily)